jgi:hypothetical protein
MTQKITHLMRNSSRLIGIMLLILLMAAAGCKSKKKAMEASNAAAEKAKIEQEAALQKQREEEQARKEAEEREKARRVEEMRMRDPAARLEQYFNAIAASTNLPSANNSITEALALFASHDTPVLIVISESGGQKDYDRPTTIKQYLNYLKDQKKQADKIGNLQFDGSGKITEVELIKQK